jgi:topoisomerase-4 subunit B
MNVTVNREGKIYESRYEEGGKIAQPLKEVGNTNKTGTIVSFLPDSKIFKDLKFNSSIIEERIRESAFLYKGLKVVFINEITNEKKIFESKTGISEYVEFINDGKTKISNVCYFEGKALGIEVEIALQYTTSSSEVIISFANSVKTREGGSHEAAFKTNLTEVINNCARK